MLNRVFIVRSKETDGHTLGRKLLQKGIKNILGLDAPRLELNQNGKPYLKGYPNFYFNISHSKDAVAVAFGNSEMGVDIEKVRPVNQKVAKRFFTENERAKIKSPTDFFTVWTQKESIIKKDGKALKDISSIDITLENNLKTFFEDDLVISLCCENVNDYKLQYILEKDLQIW